MRAIVSDTSANPTLAVRSGLTPVATATALAMAAQLVAGFAVGSSFPLPVSHGLALRFQRGPAAALVMGVLAMGFTYLVARAGFAVRRPWMGAAVCVAAGVVAGGLNGFLALTVLSSVRGDLELGPMMATSHRSLVSGFARIPPGLFWSLGTAAVVALTPRGRTAKASDVAQATWIGGFALVATSEAGLLLFRDMTITLAVTTLGLVGGLVAIGSGVRADPRRLLRSAGALAAVQAWVAALYVYWR